MDGDTQEDKLPRAGNPTGEFSSRPVPDPTVLTTEQLLRAIEGERVYVDGQIKVLEERLQGIDRATELRLKDIIGIPEQIDQKVNHVAGLTDERFRSIANQFLERDTRSERESRDNKVAVDAAFAAQKEAASEQNKSNTLAITKSEVATTETINKLAELFRTTTDGLSDKIDDLKERVNTVEARRIGAQESVSERHSSSGLYVSFVAAGIGLVGAITAIVIAIASHG